MMIRTNSKARLHASARLRDVCSFLYLNKVINRRLERKKCKIVIGGGTGKVLC